MRIRSGRSYLGGEFSKSHTTPMDPIATAQLVAAVATILAKLDNLIQIR